MPTSPIVLLQLALAVAGVAFALWKGGAAERAGACVLAANLVVGILLAETLEIRPDWLRLATDALTGMAFLWIALRRAALWMGVIMLLYAAQFGLHAYYLAVDRDPTDYLHAAINNANNSAIVLCLIAGSVAAWRRRRRAAALRPLAGAA